jgi:hypothetical protein
MIVEGEEGDGWIFLCTLVGCGVAQPKQVGACLAKGNQPKGVLLIAAVVRNTIPVTYLLHNLEGRPNPYAYYRQELKKITKLEAESQCRSTTAPLGSVC